ncbi:MAG: prepilin-type N-terminal cleavage/methylation domain-containing protein [bacterium]
MKTVRFRKRGTRKTGGFTLIELMIVVAIIGLLAAILIPNFIRARDRAQFNSCVGALSSIKTGIEVMRTEMNILTDVKCGAANLPGCLAEEIIGKGALATNLDSRIDQTCDAPAGGGAAWTSAAGIKVVAAGQYEVTGYSQGITENCLICVSEVSVTPEGFQSGATTCTSGVACTPVH